MGTLRSLPHDFRRAKDATSAVEFAILFPVLLVILVFGWQTVLYLNAARKVEQVAASISEMISQAAPPSNSTTATVNSLDLHFSYDSSLVIFPFIMRDAQYRGVAWWQDIQIDYASIQFNNLPGTNCTGMADQSACYTASVLWTSTGTSGSNYRPCYIPQLPADNTATPSNTTLPRSLFGPGSIIAIDVVYTFVPRFAAALLPSVTIRKSVFVQPRYASVIQYNTAGNDGIAVTCS